MKELRSRHGSVEDKGRVCCVVHLAAWDQPQNPCFDDPSIAADVPINVRMERRRWPDPIEVIIREQVMISLDVIKVLSTLCPRGFKDSCDALLSAVENRRFLLVFLEGSLDDKKNRT